MAKFIHRGNKKKKQVQKMFDDISSSYNFLNRFLSFGIDKYWRKNFLKNLPLKNDSYVLDVATGTGDIGFEIKKRYSCQIIGLDYSSKMLDIAIQKAKKYNMKNYTFIQGDAEALPFDDNTFDIITISYGFRNLGNFENALNEFYRVLKPNGTLGILEFSQSKSKIFSFMFNLYFNYILPFLGKLISGSNAYQYLPESVTKFATRDELINLMKNSKFINCSMEDITFGVTSIFIGKKNIE